MNARSCIVLGGLFGAIGVTAGALGAHLLKDRLEPAQLASFETAVRYQLFHALALVAVGLLLRARPSVAGRAAAWLFLAGIVLFSCGIYAWLATGARPLVHVVPFGGVALIAGWLAVLVAGARFRSD